MLQCDSFSITGNILCERSRKLIIGQLYKRVSTSLIVVSCEDRHRFEEIDFSRHKKPSITEK